MQSCLVGVLLSLLSLGQGGVLAAPAGPEDSTSGRCRCVPDQWEGSLYTVDREFALREGQSRETDSSLRIHYDFDKMTVAMHDLSNGNVAIADYSKVSRCCLFTPFAYTFNYNG